uniref:NADH-ubiquinone oxidoreductase chain 4 n=1 Tax=Tigriopus kingsejongensis TaxID=1133412 RepID=A0A650DDV6_9MAXI|nr:NADH dehydrogenase subunit 4 [Tigriopus kingsejongensis]
MLELLMLFLFGDSLVYLGAISWSYMAALRMWSSLEAHELLGSWAFVDDIGLMLLLLTKWVSILAIVSVTSDLSSGPGQSKMLFMLSVILSVVFISQGILAFYVLFELSLVPTGALILGWGHQPERLQAVKMFFAYTMLCSFPLLASILASGKLWMIESFPDLISGSGGDNSFLVVLLVVAGFMVKLPVYGGHLWLPKAHVEAPVSGSMVLAGLLLKLGGAGLLRFGPTFLGAAGLKEVGLFALAGGVVVSALCLGESDLKVLIAYSSVGHMSMVAGGCLIQSALLASSSAMIMISHGFASSGLFAGANCFYKGTGSRNMLLNSGWGSVSPQLTYLWFLGIAVGMATPPCAGFFGEIFSMAGFLGVSSGTFIMLGLLAFLGVAYSIGLFSSVHSGTGSNRGSGGEVGDYLLVAAHSVWGVGGAFMVNLI